MTTTDEGMTMRTWQDNAAEFRALDAGEGWPFAVLVACSVEKGTGGPRATGPRAPVKVTAREFAEGAGTTHTRVARYLAAWERGAALGLVPAAADLAPGDVHTVTLPEVPWDGDGGVYEPVGGGRPRDGKATDAVAIIAKRGAVAVVDAMPPEARREVAEALHDHWRQDVVAKGGTLPTKAEIDEEGDDAWSGSGLGAVVGAVEADAAQDRALDRARTFMRTHPERAQAFADSIMTYAMELAVQA